jgi:hypothetical protein
MDQQHSVSVAVVFVVVVVTKEAMARSQVRSQLCVDRRGQQS